MTIDVADAGGRVVVQPDAGRFDGAVADACGAGLGVEVGDGGVVGGDQQRAAPVADRGFPRAVGVGGHRFGGAFVQPAVRGVGVDAVGVADA